MKWGVRVIGISYKDDYGQWTGEVRHVCYLTKEGRASRDARSGATFDSEDEAWFYMALAGVMGDDENGEWAWVEPIMEGLPKDAVTT